MMTNKKSIDIENHYAHINALIKSNLVTFNLPQESLEKIVAQLTEDIVHFIDSLQRK
jgi:hypothetical protein